MGAPISVELTVCTPISQELARSSRPGATSCATIADAALSNNVSAAPSRNDRTAKDTIVVALVTKTAVNAPTATARTVSVVHITLRRSCRSTTAPPSSPNSGQGRYPATNTRAMARGSVLRPAASSGKATYRNPSPKVDTADADHRVQNGRPSLPAAVGGWPAAVIAVRGDPPAPGSPPAPRRPPR